MKRFMISFLVLGILLYRLSSAKYSPKKSLDIDHSIPLSLSAVLASWILSNSVLALCIASLHFSVLSLNDFNNCSWLETLLLIICLAIARFCSSSAYCFSLKT